MTEVVTVQLTTASCAEAVSAFDGSTVKAGVVSAAAARGVSLLASQVTVAMTCSPPALGRRLSNAVGTVTTVVSGLTNTDSLTVCPCCPIFDTLLHISNGVCTRISFLTPQLSSTAGGVTPSLLTGTLYGAVSGFVVNVALVAGTWPLAPSQRAAGICVQLPQHSTALSQPC